MFFTAKTEQFIVHISFSYFEARLRLNLMLVLLLVLTIGTVVLVFYALDYASL